LKSGRGLNLIITSFLFSPQFQSRILDFILKNSLYFRLYSFVLAKHRGVRRGSNVIGKESQSVSINLLSFCVCRFLFLSKTSSIPSYSGCCCIVAYWQLFLSIFLPGPNPSRDYSFLTSKKVYSTRSNK
jgi:hypothetical protein